MKKTIAALLSLILASSVLADDVAVMKIRIGREKPLKTVVIELYDDSAPQTVENFRKLARKGFYKGIAFHRAFPGTLVQAGDPMSRKKDRSAVGTGGPGYTLPAEIARRHGTGAVAMARLPDKINPARRSNGSQFYITLKPLREYDGAYTVFGSVVAGLEELEAISRKPTDSNDYPTDRIVIKSLKMVPREKAPLGGA